MEDNKHLMSDSFKYIAEILKDQSLNKFSLQRIFEFIKEKAKIDDMYARSVKKLLSSPLFDNYSSQTIQILKVCYTKLSKTSAESSVKLYRLSENLKMSIGRHSERLKQIKEKAYASELDRQKCMKSQPRSPQVQSVQLEHLTKLNKTKTHFEDRFSGILFSYSKIESLRKRGLIDAIQSLFTYEINKYKHLVTSLSSSQIAIEDLNKPEQIENKSREPSVNYPEVEPTHDFNAVEINNCINKCWEGTFLKTEEIDRFKEITKNPQNLKTWAALLNGKRTNGKFCIPSNTIAQMGQLMWTVLDSMEAFEDFSYAKHCMILSQTYFSMQDQQKVYLQSYIQNHSLWEQDAVWQRVVMDSTNQELTLFAANCIDLDQTIDQALPEKLKNIFTNQIIAYAHIMVCFEIPLPRINKMIEYFQVNFNIHTDLKALFSCFEFDK